MNSLVLTFLTVFVLGAYFIFAKGSLYNRLKTQSIKKFWILEGLKVVGVFTLIFSNIYLFIKSLNIAVPVAIVVSYIPRVVTKNRERRAAELRRKSWPLVIDQLSSATASGVALHAALLEIVARGPVALRDEFLAFSDSFRQEGSLEKGLTSLVDHSGIRQDQAHSSRAAQLKASILIARDFGGQEVGAILRNLSAHLRQRESAFDEVAIRQEWIKNGAVLASITPWLLLLILSLHSQTISAYNSSSGRIVLITGLFITVVAYKWINLIAHSVTSQYALK